MVLWVPISLAALTTCLSTLLLMYLERRRGVVCRDAHKPYEYLVPCTGGAAVYVGALTGLLGLYMLGIVSLDIFLSAALSLSIGVAIGLADDVLDLKPWTKILLGLLPAIPILVLGTYVPRPWIPFVGRARLYIVYPLMVVAASTVFVNGANMVDTHNGVLPLYTLTAISFAALLKFLTGGLSQEVAVLLLFVTTIAAYTPFNLYPAKIFNGNAGAFTMGAVLFVTTILARVEFYMVLASVPMFLNGFYYISSVKGFLQKERVDRPTYVDGEGCIHPAKKVHPITLVKLVLVLGRGSLTEKQLVIALYLLYLTTSLLSFAICFTLGYS